MYYVRVYVIYFFLCVCVCVPLMKDMRISTELMEVFFHLVDQV
jgi:hypothetical protein